MATELTAEELGRAAYENQHRHFVDPWEDLPDLTRQRWIESALASPLFDVLRRMTDAFEEKCESWDEWCGNTRCNSCGPAAAKIAEARAVLALKEKPDGR